MNLTPEPSSGMAHPPPDGTSWSRPAPAPARPHRRRAHPLPPRVGGGRSGCSPTGRPAGIGAITFTNRRRRRPQATSCARRCARRGRATSPTRWTNARIGTIHGFCGDILRELALRRGRNPGVRCWRRESAAALAAEAVRDALIDALDEGDGAGLDDLLAEQPADPEVWVLPPARPTATGWSGSQSRSSARESALVPNWRWRARHGRLETPAGGARARSTSTG